MDNKEKTLLLLSLVVMFIAGVIYIFAPAKMKPSAEQKVNICAVEYKDRTSECPYFSELIGE